MPKFAAMESDIFNYSTLWRKLTPIYTASEAQAMTRLVLEDLHGFTLTDIAMGAVDKLPTGEQERLTSIVNRLGEGEPVQYVLGKAWFRGRQFGVAPGVLIPRPETEELCQAIVDDWHPNSTRCGAEPLSVLDIGTGSGCIAISLALDMADASVSAIDISDKALRIASDNATTLHANVTFRKQDILQAATIASGAETSTGEWDVIVSNPPYITEREKADMEPNVLDHEPSLALFVPDDDPLRFYNAIATYAAATLRRNGRLYFEINPLFADDMSSMLKRKGFADVTVVNDQFGKRRFMKCTKETTSTPLKPCSSTNR